MKDEGPRKGAILVIGGGIAGLTAAVETADVGFPVYLIEREPFLGGRVLRINRYFPKLCPPACGLEINWQRIRKNPRITYYTMAEVQEIRGQEGSYEVTVRVNPRYVNDKCTACGECGKAAATEISNPFNYGLDRIKAVYLPHDMAFPQRYVLAREIIGTKEANRCREACKYGAIDLGMTPKFFKIPVAAIIVATGWQPYDARRIDNLAFGKVANVITSLQMERFAAINGPTGGRIIRPADGKEVKTIAFCQCAGQRDENHLPFCSRVCCLASLKQALYVREQYPDSQVYIFYIDLRAFGRNEDFLIKVQADPNIHLIRGKIAKAVEDPKTHNITVEAEATDTGKIISLSVDMLVLAIGMVPSTAAEKIPYPHIEYGENGFFQGYPGIYAAGCVKKPLDVAATVQDATGTALKAIQSAVKI